MVRAVHAWRMLFSAVLFAWQAREQESTCGDGRRLYLKGMADRWGLSMCPPCTPMTSVGNSMDSHRLLHYAGTEVSLQAQESLASELALSQFTRAECMGDHAVLKECASRVGLDASAVDAVLADRALHRDAVLEDIDRAHTEGKAHYLITLHL